MTVQRFGWEANQPKHHSNPAQYDAQTRIDNLHKQADDIIERAIERGYWLEGEIEEHNELLDEADALREYKWALEMEVE